MADLARLADHWGEVVDIDGAEGVKYYRAECCCGWRGPLRYVVKIAHEDGEVHASGTFEDYGRVFDTDESAP